MVSGERSHLSPFLWSKEVLSWKHVTTYSGIDFDVYEVFRTFDKTCTYATGCWCIVSRFAAWTCCV